MRRREFMGRVGRTGLAAAAAVVGGLHLHDRRSAAQHLAAQDDEAVRLPSYRVDRGTGAVALAVARGSQREALVRAAVGALGGMGAFVGPGDVVLVKPNAAFDRPASLGATTHPDVLRAVIALCREAGARRILVADNPINQPQACLSRTGLGQAAEELGARVVWPRPDAFRPVRIGGEALDTWPLFHGPLAQATRLIGLAPCKDHNLCGASLTMKNWYGLLGGQRAQFHQRIHAVIADFALMVQPTLVVLDATRMLVRNGPTGGSPADLAEGSALVAGTDMVAVDAMGAQLLGRDPAQLEYLHRAAARGLGTTQWQSLAWREVQVG
ncbi:MAG: DUF362 domain-containing protein [Candidatus Latescibacterota bacterium]